ncbi:MAG: peptide deformylase [Candidatus Paceibacterota bacterium]
MEILKTSNKEEDKFLHQKTKDVDLGSFDATELREIVRSMREKMIEADGIGLAANQVGLDMNMFVARDSGKFYTVINPKITKTIGEVVAMEEGCLSVPKRQGQTQRFEQVVLEGLSPNGKKLKIKAWGLLAHIFQHEVDHLNGIVYTDHAKNVVDFSNS